MLLYSATPKTGKAGHNWPGRSGAVAVGVFHHLVPHGTRHGGVIVRVGVEVLGSGYGGAVLPAYRFKVSSGVAACCAVEIIQRY